MVAWQARLRERQRIAQDMHDSLGHQLALIAVHTGALEVDRELSERQREVVGVLRNASVTAMHELREVVGILRDGVEAVDGTPLAPGRAGDETGRAARGIAGIEGLVEAARASGTSVGLRRSGDERTLAPAADHAAYRIVQEALTNAYKHAPGAPIGVELRYEPDTFVVEVLNERPTDGPAKDVVSGGQGLDGLAERARLVGGMCHAGPADGGGFRVAGMLPYGAAPVAGKRLWSMWPTTSGSRPRSRWWAMVVRSWSDRPTGRSRSGSSRWRCVGAGAEARAGRSHWAAGSRSRRSYCCWWRRDSASTS